ncbi:hypothetical protein DPMN_083679, partial [Dreissena polymorpha]
GHSFITFLNDIQYSSRKTNIFRDPRSQTPSCVRGVDSESTIWSPSSLVCPHSASRLRDTPRHDAEEFCGNRILKAFANSLNPDETSQNVASHQDPNLYKKKIRRTAACKDAACCRGSMPRQEQTRRNSANHLGVPRHHAEGILVVDAE